MELTEDQYDEIDDYLNKRMSPARTTAFRQRLEQDAALRQEVAMQHLMNQGLEAAALKQQFKALRQGVQRQRITRRVGQGMVAALVILLVGVGYWLYDRTLSLSPTAAFEAYYQPAPRARADVFLDARLAEARANYYAEKYGLSLSQLASLPTDSLRLVPFFRGLDLLMLNRPREAVQNLTLARQSPDLPTRQQADWYSALCYLQANDVKQAKKSLITIRDTPSHVYQAVAAELLEKLP